MSDNVTTDKYESASNREEKLAEFEVHKRGMIGNVQHWLHLTPAAVPLIVLIASILIFGMLIGDRFFSPFALTLVLQQVQIVGIVAAAQSLIILTAGIDLSVGTNMYLSTVVAGLLMKNYQLDPWLALLACLATGCAQRGGQGRIEVEGVRDWELKSERGGEDGRENKRETGHGRSSPFPRSAACVSRRASLAARRMALSSSPFTAATYPSSLLCQWRQLFLLF